MNAAPAPVPDYVYRAELREPPHDGDTIKLRLDVGMYTDRRGTFRLLGIQAPEVSGPGVTAEEKTAGRAARDFLAQLLARGALVVRTVKADEQDGYGRFLASVWAAGLDVSAAMVAAGHATEYDGKAKAPKWQSPGVWAPAK